MNTKFKIKINARWKQTWFISTLSQTWNKLPDTHNLKKERFNLVHDLGVTVCGQLASRQKVHKGRSEYYSCSILDLQETEKGGTRDKKTHFQVTSVTYLFPGGPAS